jgi:TonB-dependent SusC/RagA subfamily outer membrane receptor
MKLLFSLALLVSTLFVYGQNILTTEASLATVTVFRSGAEMNHKAKINLPLGSSEIVINNMANALDENTIRVGANANVTIMSVSFNKNYLKPLVKSATYFRMEDSLKKISKILHRLSGEKEAEEAVLRLLDKNSVVAGANTGLNVLELTKLATFYKNKQLEVKNNLSTLADQEEILQEKKESLQEQMKELAGDQSGTTGQIVLQVMAKNAAATDLSISYICPSAGWSPFYDLRADKTTDPLKLAYKANVAQSSGINWEKVKLTLSTGNPTVSGTAPFIAAWLLRFHSYASVNDISKRPMTNAISVLTGAAPGVQVNSGGGQPGAQSDIQVRGSGSLSASNAPLIVVDGEIYSGSLTDINPSDVATMSVLKNAEASGIYGSRGANGVVMITTKNKTLSNFTTQTENNLNTTFDIDILYDIVSNGKPHSVSLQDYSLPVHYKYYAVPKLDPNVFLMADITDYEKLNLLPGLANIIFENMYIGKSYINPGVTTDTLTLSMGRDKKLTIKREKVAELSGIKFLGNNKKQTFTFEIQVRNGKKESVDLQLKDQFPVATHKDMEIELLQYVGAKIDKETGIMSWDMTIAPGQTKKVRISYSIKYPVNKAIANL